MLYVPARSLKYFGPIRVPYNVWLKAEQLSDTGFLPLWPIDSHPQYGPIWVTYRPTGIWIPFGFKDNHIQPPPCGSPYRFLTELQNPYGSRMGSFDFLAYRCSKTCMASARTHMTSTHIYSVPVLSQYTTHPYQSEYAKKSISAKTKLHGNTHTNTQTTNQCSIYYSFRIHGQTAFFQKNLHFTIQFNYHIFAAFFFLTHFSQTIIKFALIKTSGNTLPLWKHRGHARVIEVQCLKHTDNP